MRIGEVGGLMWSDIDFDNKCIHINRSLSCQYEYGKKMLRLTEPKTHNSYRKIPFFGEAEEMYLSQQKKVKELKKTLGSRWRGEEGCEDLVFVTTMGSPVLRYHAEKEIKKVVKEINLQESVQAVREQREPVVFEDMYPPAHHIINPKPAPSPSSISSASFVGFPPNASPNLSISSSNFASVTWV
mgnify:CR=1 FL=1